MTEHELFPQKKFFSVRKVSHRSIHFCVNGHALFVSPEQARILTDEIEDVLAGPGPEIVCEVVEQVVL